MYIDTNLSIDRWNYYSGNQYHYLLTLINLKLLCLKKKIENQMLVTSYNRVIVICYYKRLKLFPIKLVLTGNSFVFMINKARLKQDVCK